MSQRAVRGATVRKSFRACAALLAGLTVAVACKMDGPFVPVVTSILVTPGTRTFTSLNVSQQFAATVQDQRGNPMTGWTVVWSTSNGTVALVNAAGLVTASSVGTATIRATIGTVVGQGTVTVTQVPGQLVKASGDGQSAAVSTTLALPIFAQVLDAAGTPVGGVTVGFAVTAGGGSVGTTSAVTTALGHASTTWTLGAALGTQAVTASATGLTSVVFNATALAGPADTVIKQTADGQSVPAGTAVSPRPAVLVRDQLGNPAAGVGVTFAITQGGGQLTGATQVTNASGIATVGNWIVGASGAQGLNATVTGLTGGGNPIAFAVTALAAGTPTSIVVADGNNQTGLLGYALNVAPAALVRDSSDNPVQGVTVTFQVTAGGGSVTGATATTDLLGIARVGSWTINLGANTMTASVSGIATPATFNASGVTTAFNIQLVYVPGTTPTAAQRAAFDSAAARWSRVIIGDLPDLNNFSVPANACGVPEITAQTQNIDDVLIFVMLVPIDGPGNRLGQAGWCDFVRSPTGLPIYGIMWFDTADLGTVEGDGILPDLILHEMGHVLGLGSLWTRMSLLTGAGGSDPFFTGAQARAAFDQIGGTGYTLGGKVPVENTGSPGTRDGHWRESVFSNELMTGFIGGGGNPLSVVTAAQFADLGYQVNLAASDPFAVSFLGLRALAAPAGIHLGNDIYRTPIVRVHDVRRGVP